MEGVPEGVEIVQVPKSRKVACAHCGIRGYLGGKWMLGHIAHVRCGCGSVVPAGSLGQHRGSMKRHGHPCPDGYGSYSGESDGA